MTESSFVVVPRDQLSETALHSLVDEYILREGTDYGLVEVSLDEKRKRINSQMARGDVLIVFDPHSETCTLIRQQDLSKLKTEPVKNEQDVDP